MADQFSNVLNFTAQDILQFLTSNSKVNLDGVLKEMTTKAYIEKIHKHEIWFAENEGRFKTYVPDATKPKGIRMITCKDEKKLYAKIIEFYRVKQPYIKEVFQEWIDFKMKYNELTEQSKTRYTNIFRSCFPDSCKICKKYISEIKPSELEDFIKSTIIERELTKTGYRDFKIVLKAIFDYAKRNGYTNIDFQDFLKDLYLPDKIFKQSKRKTDEELVYTDEELTQIKKYVNSRCNLRELGVLLAFYTGLRVGELSALNIEDIKSIKGNLCLDINKTEVHYSSPDAKGTLRNVCKIQDRAKTATGNRYVLLSDEAVETLDKIQSLYPSTNGYLFEENGTRIKSQGFSRALGRICKALDIPFRPMHATRRTYGSILLKNNVPDAFVSRQMGHSDISTTLKYYCKDNDTSDVHAQQLNNAFAAI